MTLEHSILAGLKDIRAIVLECQHCCIRLRLQWDKIDLKRLEVCPQCREHWMTADEDHQITGPRNKGARLIDLLRQVREQTGARDVNKEPVRIFFEFEPPK